MPYTYSIGQDMGKREDLPILQDGALFLGFVSSFSPQTRQPWCPDVRLALPDLEATFIRKDLLAIFVLDAQPEQ